MSLILKTKELVNLILKTQDLAIFILKTNGLTLKSGKRRLKGEEWGIPGFVVIRKPLKFRKQRVELQDIQNKQFDSMLLISCKL